MYSPKSNLENNDSEDMQENLWIGTISCAHQCFNPLNFYHLIFCFVLMWFNYCFCHTFHEVHHEMSL
jgi:hypothetical protein